MRTALSKYTRMLEGMLDLNHANSLLNSGLGIKIRKASNSDFR